MIGFDIDRDESGAPEGGSVASGSSERIVAAALSCVSRWGVAKTTLDDIAREAGCARATLYRMFPGGREALFEAVLATEASRLFDGIVRRAANQDSLEDVLVAVISEAGQELSRHTALQFLLAYEPEAILPHLAFHKLDPVLQAVATVVGPLLTPWLALHDGAPDVETAARSAEWVTRIAISYLTSVAPDVDLREEDSVRRLVRLFIIPGLQSPASAASAKDSTQSASVPIL